MREFREEIGLAVKGSLIDLGWVKQKGGKIVYAWALEAGARSDDLAEEQHV